VAEARRRSRVPLLSHQGLDLDCYICRAWKVCVLKPASLHSRKVFLMRFVLFAFALLASCFPSTAQQPVFWANPSFEDQPARSRPPIGWYYCDDVGESPPDTHPDNFFGVKTEAQDGITYLGMVVRDNGTSEGVGQLLGAPLIAGQCYELRLFAARSDTYLSRSRTTYQEASFRHPVKLRVWGGQQNCQKAALLAESPPVSDISWREFRLSLQPDEPYSHLLLETAHRGDTVYNGNVLVDHLSPLLPVDCESGALVREPVPAAAPAAVSRQELPEKVGSHLEKVVQAADGRLEEHLVWEQGGAYHQLNRHLWEVGRLMAFFPGLQLQLSGAEGRATGFSSYQQRQIRYALRSAGLSQEQFRLRKWAWGRKWQKAGDFHFRIN